MSDKGTPERWQHGRLSIRAVEPKAGYASEDVAADLHATAFDYLYDKGHITAPLLDAGLHFAALRLRAGLEPRQVSSYNPLGSGSEITDDQAEARLAFNAAVKALGGTAKAVLRAVDGSTSPGDVPAVIDGLQRLGRHFHRRNI